MCGIVGIATDGLVKPDIGVLKAMAELINHRGPDGEGYYTAPGIGLGHKRLAIVDIKDGNQPVISEDKSVILVYNGEVYNFMELRNLLLTKGYRFYTHCDSEVVLKAYLEWGIDAVHRFNGMFAFAIWDSRSKTLHLVRDRLGIKPLYYYCDTERIVFASEIKALFADLTIPRAIESRTIVDFATYQNVIDHKTFYEGIFKCPPGHRIVWNRGKLDIYQYWDIDLAHTDTTLTFEAACEVYRETLQVSVKDHLMGDVKVGGYLSGGFDSTSVTAMASLFEQEGFHTFTGYFDEAPKYDERSGAKLVAEQYKTTHHEIGITWLDYLNHFEKTCYHLDEPTLGSGALPQFMVAREVSNHVKVVLTGHGGDELFAGYPVFKSALFKDSLKNPRDAILILRGLQGEELIRFLYFLVLGLFDNTVRNGLFSMYGKGKRKRLFSREFMDSLDSYDPLESVKTLLEGKDLSNAQRVSYLYLKTYLPTLLLQEDKISMAHSVEARTPLLDNRIVELSNVIPMKTKLHSNSLKAIPKAAMNSYLPGFLYSQPKRGFPTPIIEWYRRKLLSHTKELLLDGTPKALEGVFNRGYLEREMTLFTHVTGRLPFYAYALAHRYYSLATLYMSIDKLFSIKPYRAA